MSSRVIGFRLYGNYSERDMSNSVLRFTVSDFET